MGRSLNLMIGKFNESCDISEAVTSPTSYSNSSMLDANQAKTNIFNMVKEEVQPILTFMQSIYNSSSYVLWKFRMWTNVDLNFPSFVTVSNIFLLSFPVSVISSFTQTH